MKGYRQTVGRGHKEKCNTDISETSDHVLNGVLILRWNMNKDYNEAPESSHCSRCMYVEELAVSVLTILRFEEEDKCKKA